MIRYLWLLIPTIAAFSSWKWMPFSYWRQAQDGLLFFLGLIVAALVPVIIATANFSRNNKVLCLDQVKRLNKALERQQRLWIGLLSLNFFAALMLILCIGFSESISTRSPAWLQEYGGTDAVLSGGLSFFVVMAIIRGMVIMPGVMSLQKLQSDIAVKIVEERLKEDGKKKQVTDLGTIKLPEGYGKIIKNDNP